MFPIPRFALMTDGIGKGSTPLTSFDNALLNAGIGNLNLLKLSSVLPPKACVVRLNQRSKIPASPGQIVPAVYTSFSESQPGITISAAIAVIQPSIPENNGMIFEASGALPENVVRERAERMAIESMVSRDIKWREISICSCSVQVKNEVACVVAAVILTDMEPA